RDFCLRSASQISAHSHTVAKNDEIGPGKIFVSNQPVKFQPIPTLQINDEIVPYSTFVSDQLSNFSPFRHTHSDTVVIYDEIAPGTAFVFDQSVKFKPILTPSRPMTKLPQPIPTPSRQMTKFPLARFSFPINLSNIRPFRRRRDKGRNYPWRDFSLRSTCQILAHSDTVVKNDEIAPAHSYTVAKNDEIGPAHSDTVAINDEIAPGTIFVSDQPVKFQPTPTPSRQMMKLLQ
ncbi:Hypothetical predicted protein, partial [Olea europaea subsp. europaea]